MAPVEDRWLSAQDITAAWSEAELRTRGGRKGHKCPFCRLPVPDKLRWKTQGGGKACPLMCRTA